MSNDERLEFLIPNLSKSFLGNSFSDTPTMDELQRCYIQFLTNRTGGRIGGPGSMAELLGLKPTTLYTCMRKFGLS